MVSDTQAIRADGVEPKLVPHGNQGKPRLEFLDCLRGVAALMVLYLHVSRDSILSLGLAGGFERDLMYAFTYIADVGKIGVVLFFAISGVIIPASFKSRYRPALMFVVSRFFRLYPAYWVSLLAGVIALFALQGRPIPWRTVVANFTMVQAALGAPDILGVYWTLFIEWLFYAFCLSAFLAGVLGETRFSFAASTGTLFAALALAGLRYATHRKLPVAILTALSIMVWASLWRNYLLDRDLTARRLAILYLALFALIFPLISLLAYNFDTGFDETWYRYTISYFIALGLFVVFTASYRLTSKVLTWLGTVSYSLYLFHSLIVGGLERLHHNRLPFGSAHLFFLECLALSLIFADVSYRFIERPGIRIGNRVRSAFQTRNGSAQRVSSGSSLLGPTEL